VGSLGGCRLKRGVRGGRPRSVNGTSDELLLLDEVAQQLRVSVESVRHWIKTGRLPSIRPGKRRLVRRGDLDVFLERNKTGGKQ
jgi:excisionase family DNA binding protein